MEKWQCVTRSLYIIIINNLYDVIHTLPQSLYGSTIQMFPQNHEYICSHKGITNCSYTAGYRVRFTSIAYSSYPNVLRERAGTLIILCLYKCTTM